MLKLMLACGLLALAVGQTPAPLPVYSGGWDPRFCCYPPGEECCPAGVTSGDICPECLDIALILDRSSSIGTRRWTRHMVPFFKMFANTSSPWTIGVGPTDYKIGVVTFASDATLRWNWNSSETESSANLMAAFDVLPDPHGLTSTSLALKIAREQIIGGPGNRPQCPDVGIIVTDGAETVAHGLNITEEIELFHDATDDSIAVGVTTSVPRSKILKLASRLDFAIEVAEFNQLVSHFQVVINSLCTNNPTCCPYKNPLVPGP